MLLENGYSPLLSLFTAAFELGAAAWVLRLGLDAKVRNLLVGLFVILAGYQLAEIWVCNAPEDAFRARVAFCDVTWLPVLGLELVAVFAGLKSALWKGVLRFQWAFALGLCAWMMLDQSFVIGTVCSTVVATYLHGTPFHNVFGGWYESLMFAIVIGAGVGMVRSDSVRTRANLLDFQIGILGFTIPAFLAQLILKKLDPSLPSLMCHFALILAVFMVRIAWRESRHVQGSAGAGA